MSVTITTAASSNHIADAGIGTPVAATTGGMAFDAVELGFQQADSEISDLAAKVLAQGSANNGSSLRAITDAYMTGGNPSSASQRLVAIAATSSELLFAHTAEITSGQTGTVTLPNCAYAYPVLAGFNYPLSSEMEVETVAFKSNSGSATYATGQLSWQPTITLSNGSTSQNGNATFLAIGIVNGSNIPPSQTVQWSPSDGPIASCGFNGLAAEMGSAAVFVDAFSVTYGASQKVMDFALATFNQTVQVTSVQEQGKYNVLVTWSPELMMRDQSSNYLDTSSSSITFRVFVFPGTAVMSNG